MIKANCGCYLIEEEISVIHLICDVHLGSELYGDYDGKSTEICDYLIDLTSKKESET